jgi:hypothetical protein
VSGTVFDVFVSATGNGFPAIAGTDWTVANVLASVGVPGNQNAPKFGFVQSS